MEERFSSKANQGTGKDNAEEAWLRLTWKVKEMAEILVFLGAIAENGESMHSVASRAIQLAARTGNKLDPEKILKGVPYAIQDLKNKRSLNPTKLAEMLGYVKDLRLEAEAELKPKAKAEAKTKVKAEAEAKAPAVKVA